MNKNYHILSQLLATESFPINIQEFIQLISDAEPKALFIKDHAFKYVYANAFFTGLMGLAKPHQILGLNDTSLCADKELTNRYASYDTEVFEKENPLPLLDTIKPKYNDQYVNVMQGKQYPLYLNSDKPNFVLGIVSPTIKLLKLDWNTIFSLDPQAIDQLLTKKSYAIRAYYGEVRLSKRELQVLISLLKGQHAGESAYSLQLKQTTIESYIANIKNKLGVNNKSEIINFVIDTNLLEQIIL